MVALGCFYEECQGCTDHGCYWLSLDMGTCICLPDPSVIDASQLSGMVRPHEFCGSFSDFFCSEGHNSTTTSAPPHEIDGYVIATEILASLLGIGSIGAVVAIFRSRLVNFFNRAIRRPLDRARPLLNQLRVGEIIQAFGRYITEGRAVGGNGGPDEEQNPIVEEEEVEEEEEDDDDDTEEVEDEEEEQEEVSLEDSQPLDNEQGAAANLVHDENETNAGGEEVDDSEGGQVLGDEREQAVRKSSSIPRPIRPSNIASTEEQQETLEDSACGPSTGDVAGASSPTARLCREHLKVKGKGMAPNPRGRGSASSSYPLRDRKKDFTYTK